MATGAFYTHNPFEGMDAAQLNAMPDLINDPVNGISAATSRPDGIRVEFLNRAVQHGPQSLAAGRPIFVDQEIIRFYMAGDMRAVPERKVTQGDRQRYAQAYAAFKNGSPAPINGTPLKEWPAIGTSMIANLGVMHIFSVEALAEASDAVVQDLGISGGSLRSQARAWLLAAKDSAVASKLAADNDRLEATIAAQASQMAQLIQNMALMNDRLAVAEGARASTVSTVTLPDAPAKRPPGRPPNADRVGALAHELGKLDEGDRT